MTTGAAAAKELAPSGKLRAAINFGNAVLVQSNTYGATVGTPAQIGSAWLQPQAILPARIVKFGVQVTF